MENYELLSEITDVRSKIFKRISSTDFKYVYMVSYDGVKTYRAELAKYKFYKCYANVRDAAKAIDIMLIKNGKSPVNILKKK